MSIGCAFLLLLADVVPPAVSKPPQPDAPAVRSAENLAGQTDTARGEGRRNENVQVNLVDTNSARELNVRIGVTATIVEEFHADRGYFATEYGGAPSPSIHVAPRVRSAPHASLSWNHTNSLFAARAFFQAGSVQPARRNQFGAIASVPLWRGAFFTSNLSLDQNRGQVNGNVLIPLQNEREPLTNDPVLRAFVLRLMDAFPNVPPNRTDIAARSLNTNSPQSTRTAISSGDLSQAIGTADTISFRYAFTGQQVDAFQFTKGQNPNTDNKNHSARITWTRNMNPNSILESTLAFDRQGTLLLPTGDAVGPAYVIGLQVLGPPSVVPINRSINRFRAESHLRRRIGRHNLSMGGGLTRLHYNGFETEDSRPTFMVRDDFGRSAIDNLRRGTPSIYSQSFGIFARSFRNWEPRLFAGDQWTISPRLSLRAALRWEPWTLPSDAMGLSRPPFQSDWNNLGGSFGAAYRLSPGVVRFGAAVSQGQLFPVTYGQDRLNPPYNFSVSILAPDAIAPLRGLSPSDLNGTGRAVRFDIAPDLATPYSYQYNASWESSLPGGWKTQLSYVGSRTHKLFLTYQLNRGRVVPGIPFTTATTNLRRADQNYYQRFYTSNGARSYYDAGRVSLQSPSWKGGAFQTQYWWSKAIDQGADYTVTGGGQERWGQAGQTERGLQSDMRGLSNFDQPHALLLQANWTSARSAARRGAWQVSSVVLLKNGTPFTVDAGSDGPGFGNVDGTSGDRPNIVDPSILGRTIGNPDTSVARLPRSAFAFIQAPRELAGNLGRNTFRKGTIFNWNAAVARTFPLKNDFALQLTAEAINLSNTPQFAEPGRSLTATNFGQITNTLNDGRAFRFLLGLRF
ncbi:MAG: hypothetical protein ACKV2U_32210 [Bryobacteraceae bacterium]